MNGENLTAKTPLGDFQITTPETPLLSQQTVTSKGISNTLPTYSLTLIPTPNWTCYVVTVPLLMHGSQVCDFNRSVGLRVGRRRVVVLDP